MNAKYTIEAFLYQRILKPILFLLEAESVHNLMASVGYWFGKFTITRKLMGYIFSDTSRARYKKINGIMFRGPVGLAAGFDYEAKLPHILPSLGFGFTTVGTVTYQPYEGNAVPRLARLPDSQALLVNKGFKTPGAEEIIRRLAGQRFAIPVGVSIGSTNTSFNNLDEQISDIVKSFKLFESSNVKHQYYELNISCPNTQSGQPFTTPARLEKLLRAVKRLRIDKPIYVKMPIDYSTKSILSLLRIIAQYPIAGVIFGNLTKDKDNPAVTSADQNTWKQSRGNLSGKPTWDRSNALIALTKKNFGDRFTIIGTGGIFSPADAQEKIKLGADLVQLITGMIYRGPQLISQINSYPKSRKL